VARKVDELVAELRQFNHHDSAKELSSRDVHHFVSHVDLVELGAAYAELTQVLQAHAKKEG